MARACSGPMPGSSSSSAGFARLTLTRFGMSASSRTLWWSEGSTESPRRIHPRTRQRPKLSMRKREMHAVAVTDDDDDGRMQVRVVLVLAARAALAPFALEALGTVTAAGTEAARRFPPEGLHGHAAEREQIVGQARALHRHEGLML